jgi:hypothetical protein
MGQSMACREHVGVGDTIVIGWLSGFFFFFLITSRSGFCIKKIENHLTSGRSVGLHNRSGNRGEPSKSMTFLEG